VLLSEYGFTLDPDDATVAESLVLRHTQFSASELNSRTHHHQGAMGAGAGAGVTGGPYARWQAFRRAVITAPGRHTRSCCASRGPTGASYSPAHPWLRHGPSDDRLRERCANISLEVMPDELDVKESVNCTQTTYHSQH